MSRLKYVLKRDLFVVRLSADLANVLEVLETSVLPAGCLVESVESPAVSDEDSQVILKSLDEFKSPSIPEGTVLYTQASNDDLIEVSIFTASLLKPERQFRLRLLVCRDENWLCEAIHIGEDSSVLVTLGWALFGGIVRYVGSLNDDPDSRSFGVELTYPNIDLLRELLPHATDGRPFFECEDGRGVFASITSVRLAEVSLPTAFKGFKPFSARTKKASNIRAIKSGIESGKIPIENGHASAVGQSQRGPEAIVIRPLNMGDRVVWIRDDGRSVRGTVRFIGKLRPDDKEQMAVEFEEPEGEKGFTGLTNRQVSFRIPDGYGKIMAFEDFSQQLVREEDFGYFEATPHKEPSRNVPDVPQNSQDGLKKYDRVIWFDKNGDAVRGHIRFIGRVPEKKGSAATVERVGVLLDEPKGDPVFTGKGPDGAVLFECTKKRGVLTSAETLMLEREYDSALPSVPQPAVNVPASKISEPPQNRKNEPIRVGDEVVWRDPKEVKQTPYRGTVKWSGVPGGSTYNQEMFAVEFKQPVGQKGWTGKHRGDQLFSCKPDHARFVYPRDVVHAEEYDAKIKKVFSKNSSENRPQTETQPPSAAAPTPRNPKSEDWVTRYDSHGDYRLNDRVLLTVADMEHLPMESKIGTLRWIGVAKRISHVYRFGVEMDNRIGSPENVLHCGFVGTTVSGYLQAFECRPGHGKIVLPADLMTLEVAGIEDPRAGKAEGDWTVVDYSKHATTPPVVAPPPAAVTQVFPPALVTGPVPVRPVAVLRATFQPTVPNAVFQVAVGQKVMTYLDNQQSTATVIWLGRLPNEEGDWAGLWLDKFTPGAPGFGEAPGGFGIGVPVHVLHPIPAVAQPYHPNEQRQFLPATGHGLPHLPFPFGPQVAQMPPPRLPVQFAEQHLRAASPLRPLGVVPPAFNFLGAGNVASRLVAPVDPRRNSTTTDDVLGVVANAERDEKALADRKTTLAVAVFQMEEAGLKVMVDKDDATTGNVRFLPKPADRPYIVKRAFVSEDGMGIDEKARDLESLPPIFLHFHIPPQYPEAAPVFRLQCNWLPDHKGVELCRLLELQCIRLHNEGMQHALYEVVNSLRDSLLEKLGIGLGITFTSVVVLNSGILDVDALPELCVFETDKKGLEVYEKVVKFSEKKRNEEEENSKMECPVCGENVVPAEYTYFSQQCPHMFCRNCITGHVRAQVENGNTANIGCPGDGCKITATLHELNDVIDQTILEQFGPQLLDRSISLMKDTMRCPHCQYVMIAEAADLGANERYVTCPHPECGQQFCPHCRGKSHGDQPCMTFEQKRELRDQYTNGSPEEKERLETQHGKDNITHAIEDYEAEELIRRTGKPCPSCKTPIEKSAGCNHMTCTKCSNHFCWTCGQGIKSTDVAAHFARGGCNQFDDARDNLRLPGFHGLGGLFGNRHGLEGQEFRRRLLEVERLRTLEFERRRAEQLRRRQSMYRQHPFFD